MWNKIFNTYYNKNFGFKIFSKLFHKNYRVVLKLDTIKFVSAELCKVDKALAVLDSLKTKSRDRISYLESD